MKLSTEIKKHFRNLGIPVRVQTATVKHSFIQVWIPPKQNPNIMADLEWEYEFPLEMRQKLLRIVYGQDCTFADQGNAGNVRPYSMSLNEKEWRELTKEESAVTVTI